MTGGTISGNISGEKGGGGVYTYANDHAIELSGKPLISDNTAGGDGNDFYLNDGRVFKIVDKLTDSQQPIPVYLNTAPETDADVVITAGWSTFMGKNDPADHFTIENPGCGVQVKNSEVQAVVSHTHDGITFQEWTDDAAVEQYGEGATAATCLPKSGSYYLFSDVKLRATTELDGDLNLCLNDHSITMTGKGSVYKITGDDMLNLYDCGATERYYFIGDMTHLGVVCDEATAELHTNHGSFTGGYITGGRQDDGSGGAVAVTGLDDSCFTMYGGTIIGCSAKEGGAVAVYVTQSSSTEFTMNGGSILGCTAETGAGVYVGAGCGFTMAGGSIVQNTATTKAGGVYVQKTRTILVSGDCRITDNVCITDGESAEQNVYLNQDDPGSSHGYITVAGALGNDASIGVTMEGGSGIFTNTDEEDTGYNDPARFSSDNSEYTVRTTTENQLSLTDGTCNVTYNGNGAEYNTPPRTATTKPPATASPFWAEAA